MNSLPVRFEENVGQFDPAARYVARGGNYTLFLAKDEAVLSMPWRADEGKQKVPAGSRLETDVVRMRLGGVRSDVVLSPLDPVPGVSNYLIGNDPAEWHTSVPAYDGVRYSGVYEGIDLVFRQGTGVVEYDFEITPKADPGDIALHFEGVGRPSVDAGGNLVLKTPSGGDFRQSKPRLFQVHGKDKHPVDGAFTVGLDGTVGFRVGTYDRAKPLVIDPVLTYSSYLSGTTGSSVATDVATGASGAAFVTGYTFATDFPTKGPLFPARQGPSDRFVAKFNTTDSGLSSLAYATYLGGSYGEDGTGSIAVDTSGNAYVTGLTTSGNFPTTVGAYDTGCGTNVPAMCNGTSMTYTDGQTTAGSTTFVSVKAAWTDDTIGAVITGTNIPAGTTITGYGPPNQNSVILSAAATGSGTGLTFTIADRGRSSDAFLTKLSATGAGLLYSTYLGGQAEDAGTSLDLGAPGIAYVGGETQSSIMPTAGVPFDTGCGTDTFCNADDHNANNGASTNNSTTYTVADESSVAFYSGDVGRSITGTNILAGTVIQGVVNHYTISLSAPATGTGTGLSFTVIGKYPQVDAFVAKVDTAAANAASLQYATFLGGSTAESMSSLAVDASGRIYVTGMTDSADFPTSNAAQATPSGFNDAFVAKLDPGAGSLGLAYGTYFGGSGADEGGAIAVDGAGNAYVAGETSSTNLTTKAPTGFSPFDASANGDSDGFAAKFNTGAIGALSLVYSTYLGGAAADSASGIAVDGANPPNATIVGSTRSANFPQVRQFQPYAGGSDAFVTQLNGTGSALGYSTFLGGSGDDIPHAVALDASANPYVAGETTSSNFPTSAGAYQTSAKGSGANAFLTRVDPATDSTIVTNAVPRGGPDTGGTPVVITGQNFTGVTAVNFGAVAVTASPCPATPTAAGCFTVNSLTQITAVSPACGACTTADITVSVGGATSNSTRFTFGEGLSTRTGTCTGPVGNACAGTGSFNGPTAVRLADGRVLSIKGANAAQLYNPATGTWSATGICPSTCMDIGFSATVLPSGKVLVAGGSNSGNASAAANVYDPATGTWTTINSMTQARSFHTATLLNNGKVLVAGGCTANQGLSCENPLPGLKTAELFDPAANGGAGGWAATGSMSTGRWGHTATLLSAGQVLVAGGYVDALQGTTSAERYDLTGAGSWTSAGTMGAIRLHHTATLLVGGACNGASPPTYCGKVLITGGGNFLNAPFATAELYDPAASGAARWQATGPMANVRKRHRAVLLPNGKVLVGGYKETANSDVLERFDPATGTFGSAGAVSWATGTTGAVGQLVLLAPGPVSACGTRCGTVLISGAALNGERASDLYTPRPTITAVSPTSGSGTSAVPITITGTGLASVTQVRLGTGRTAAVTPDATNPDTTLVVRSPGTTNPAGGQVDVVAVSPGGISATSTAAKFTFNPWGFLRVTTPAGGLAAQIQLDGNFMDTFGTTWVHVDTGSHTLCFTDVEGWETPACQTINIAQGATTTVAANFVQRGNLQVALSPAGTDGTIVVDGVPRNNYGMFTDLPTGSHQVCFENAPDYLAPGCQTVTVNAGQTTSVTGTYTFSAGTTPPANKGFLRVTTNPALNSQISFGFNGGAQVPRDTFGTTWVRVDPGSYSVCFRSVIGWNAVPCQTVTVTAGVTTSVQGNFTRQGNLQVAINPAGQDVVVSVDGIARDDYGMFTQVPAGTHTVCFGVAAAYSTPACQTVNVAALPAPTTVVTGVYTLL